MTTDIAEGLRRLKTGALLTFLSQALLTISSIIVIVGLVFRKAVTVPFAITILLSTILGLVGLIQFFIATVHLKRANPNYVIGSVGLAIQLVGVVPMIIFKLPTILALINTVTNVNRAIGIVIYLIFSAKMIFIVGGILIIIGAILFGMMLIRMDEIDSGFKTAGTIYLIGAVLNFVFGFIGNILTMISSIIIYRTSSRVLLNV
ncbi:hypothetical protein [Archaeoglobus sp.]